MFCPKCGTKNPENGKFCRSCGTDLHTVNRALSGELKIRESSEYRKHKRRKASWDSAFGKLFTGIAFVGVTIALANSAVGRGWWFWMLIPALTMIGAGLAQIMQIKQNQRDSVSFNSAQRPGELGEQQQGALPASRTDYVSPVRSDQYQTGDLVPPSVTENTTRHLELDSEGETMTLPKQNG
ncbi:MAG: zinc-ribbon domain-containing protein [Pyrinomonadaceae bacterium]